MHRLFFSLSSALWAATTPVAPPPDQCLGAQANWTSVEVLYEPCSPRCAPWRAQARDLQNPASSSEFCSLPDGPQSTRIYADIITEGVSGVGVGPVADPDAFPSLLAGLKKMLCLRRQGLTTLWHRQVGRRGDPLQPSGSGASTEPPRASPSRASSPRVDSGLSRGSCGTSRSSPNVAQGSAHGGQCPPAQPLPAAVRHWLRVPEAMPVACDPRISSETMPVAYVPRPHAVRGSTCASYSGARAPGGAVPPCVSVPEPHPSPTSLLTSTTWGGNFSSSFSHPSRVQFGQVNLDLVIKVLVMIGFYFYLKRRWALAVCVVITAGVVCDRAVDRIKRLVRVSAFFILRVSTYCLASVIIYVGRGAASSASSPSTTFLVGAVILAIRALVFIAAVALRDLRKVIKRGAGLPMSLRATFVSNGRLPHN